LWYRILGWRSRRLSHPALRVTVNLAAKIADQHRPHLRISSQQYLQILVTEKLDFAAHVAV
jgi:hypothetical protein